MNRRTLFPLALLAATTLLTSCSNNSTTTTTLPPATQYLYASCNMCVGTTTSNSTIVTLGLNSSSATPVTTLTAPTGADWSGVQTDSAGNMYVVVSPLGTPQIEVFAAGATGAATPIRTITSSSFTPSTPSNNGYNFIGFIVAPNGTVYYSDGSKGLLVFPATANGASTPTVTMPAIFSASGVVDAEGNLFFINLGQGAGGLQVLPPNFTATTVPGVITVGGVGALLNGEIDTVALDSAENIYVTSYQNVSQTAALEPIYELPHTTTTATVTPIKTLSIPTTNGLYIGAFALDRSNNLYVETSSTPLTIEEFSSSATTGTPTPINTITTTYTTPTNSFDQINYLAVH